jgi:K+ transporter
MSVNGLVACATAATIVASVGVIARAYKKDPGAAETSVIPNKDSVPNTGQNHSN